MQLTANLEENRSKLYEIFPISTSYDLISRDLYLGKTKAFWLGINGFCKNDLLQKIFADLQDNSYTKDLTIENLELFV